MATSYALLIGIADYKGLTPIPSAVMDVDKLHEVLVNPGGFPPDNVEVLKNPNLARMRSEIESFYKNKRHDDLLLLYYSGHGDKNKDRQLLLCSAESDRHKDDELIQSTALLVREILTYMEHSASKRQVLILDCCYSGAVLKGMDNFKGKNGKNDYEHLFGGVGRVILTSSSNVEPSRASESRTGLSPYTRFLVEGIETGAADQRQRGWVDATDLHNFTRLKVQQIYRGMNPKIFVFGECDMRICKVLKDSTAIYTQRVEKYAAIHNGELPENVKELLERLRAFLELSEDDAKKVQENTLKPFAEYQCT